MWDAFKAAARRHHQTFIARVRRADLTRAEREATIAEELFVRTRDSQHYAQLQLMTKEVLILRTSLTQKKLHHHGWEGSLIP